MEKILISPPFGNWLNFDGCTSTLGTFTWEYRGGLLKQLWKALTTIRYYCKLKSYKNKMGLPNKGIKHLTNDQYVKLDNKIVSIHGFNFDEWQNLILYCERYICAEAVELNFSCPNIGHLSAINEAVEVSKCAIRNLKCKIIVKLSPLRWMQYGKALYKEGIRYFNLCNTIPTPGGGLSGKVLKQYSIWACEEFRQTFGNDVIIIGSGGINCWEDVKDYFNIPVDHISLGSMLFNPFNHRKVSEFISKLGETNEN